MLTPAAQGGQGRGQAVAGCAKDAAFLRGWLAALRRGDWAAVLEELHETVAERRPEREQALAVARDMRRRLQIVT